MGWAAWSVSFWEHCCCQPVCSVKHLHHGQKELSLGWLPRDLDVVQPAPSLGLTPSNHGMVVVLGLFWDGKPATASFSSSPKFQLQLSPWLPRNTLGRVWMRRAERVQLCLNGQLGFPGRCWPSAMVHAFGSSRWSIWGEKLRWKTGFPYFQHGATQAKTSAMRNTFC